MRYEPNLLRKRGEHGPAAPVGVNRAGVLVVVVFSSFCTKWFRLITVIRRLVRICSLGFDCVIVVVLRGMSNNYVVFFLGFSCLVVEATAGDEFGADPNVVKGGIGSKEWLGDILTLRVEKIAFFKEG